MTVPFRPLGAWTALATPFLGDGVDEPLFQKLVAFQVSEGISGLVPCGTTGESPTLAWDEHQRVVELTVETVGGRAGVLAGCGSNNTAEAIAATRDAQLAGASAALLVDCYYNGPSSAELRTEYYERVLDAVVDFPLVPYLIPARTGCVLSAADVALLHRSAPDRVVAVKEATGDLTRMRLERELAGDTLAIMSGDDDMTLAMIMDEGVRSTGVISVMSNIVPGTIVRLVAAATAGDRTGAQELVAKVAPLLSLVGISVSAERTLPGGRRVGTEDKYRNPVPVKTMMAGLGMLGAGGRSHDGNDPLCRPPLGRMSAAAVRRARDALRSVHEASPDVFAPIEAFFDVAVGARLADDALWSSFASGS